MKRNGNPWKYENGYWHEWKKRSDGSVGWVQQVGIPVDEIQQHWADNRERDKLKWAEKEAQRKFGNKLWNLSK